MEKLSLKINHPYTIVCISEMLAITQRMEITITGYDNQKQRYTYKPKSKRKEYYLYPAYRLEEHLIFEGHGLPFVLDSEENDRFLGNACFNFLTDNPADLREFLKKNCLTPLEGKQEKILYTTGKGSEDYHPLFPEKANE